ncbi:hypothetical protein JG688_00017888 [Phytophthora aleatoria]|uniref:Uncharacterized protein n=1 Tax=Phytophthora aleatoria TaxID=2496075 RepID=A0A8J5LY91_9STRA|nr:hypothetical protein JG688_00017888 [Phytophthora aleatoria]
MSDDEEMSLPVPSFIKSRVTNWRINSWIKNRYSDDYKFKIDGWLKESATTTKAWDHLGLTGLTAAQVKTADGRSTYVRYVIALNEKTKNVDVEEWPKLLGGGSPTEMLCKENILKLLGRNELEIRFMLDIPSLHRTP